MKFSILISIFIDIFRKNTLHRTFMDAWDELQWVAAFAKASTCDRTPFRGQPDSWSEIPGWLWFQCNVTKKDSYRCFFFLTSILKEQLVFLNLCRFFLITSAVSFVPWYLELWRQRNVLFSLYPSFEMRLLETARFKASFVFCFTVV